MPNNSCKQCSNISCDAEIPRTKFSISAESPTKFIAKIDQKLFFKKFDANNLRRLQAAQDEPSDYCSSRVKGLEKGIDYKITTSSSLKSNILECVSDLEFFRSFKNKELSFDVNPTYFSGNNVITDKSHNPVYIESGSFEIQEFQRYFLFNIRTDPSSEQLGSVFCTICIVLYALFVIVCVLFAIWKGDNFLKWSFLQVTQYLHLLAFFISLDFELPINLRVFLLCLYRHFIRWLGALRYAFL